MGIILPRPALRENVRLKIEARLKLLDQLRKPASQPTKRTRELWQKCGRQNLSDARWMMK
jgi:hypothetical protein